MTFESDVTEAGLFDAMTEHQAVRMAIMQESNVPDPVQAAEDDRHRCEVESVIRRYFPDGGKDAAAYMELVEKKRGIGPANRLREDCRKEWAKRRDALLNDLAGQA